jgi:hypothetical protein
MNKRLSGSPQLKNIRLPQGTDLIPERVRRPPSARQDIGGQRLLASSDLYLCSQQSVKS